MTRPQFPLPTDLALPFRDIVRGLRQKSVMVRPVVDLIPSPLRDPLRSIAHSLLDDIAVKAAVPSHEAMVAAGKSLRTGGGDPARMAGVLAYGAALQLAFRDMPDTLASETVAALCWADVRGSGTPAADLVAALVRRDFVGRAPGFMHDLPAADAREVCAAVVLWAMADRTEGEDEAELARIAVWLVRETDLPEGAALQDVLARTAEMI